MTHAHAQYLLHSPMSSLSSGFSNQASRILANTQRAQVFVSDNEEQDTLPLRASRLAKLKLSLLPPELQRSSLHCGASQSAGKTKSRILTSPLEHSSPWCCGSKKTRCLTRTPAKDARTMQRGAEDRLRPRQRQLRRPEPQQRRLHPRRRQKQRRPRSGSQRPTCRLQPTTQR